MVHVAITFSFFPSVLHSSVERAGDGWLVAATDGWVAASDDDDLARDQTDIGLITVHPEVEKILIILFYWSIVLDASHIWYGNTTHTANCKRKTRYLATLPIYSVGGHSRM